MKKLLTTTLVYLFIFIIMLMIARWLERDDIRKQTTIMEKAIRGELDKTFVEVPELNKRFYLRGK